MLLLKLEMPPGINRMKDLPIAIRRNVAKALGAGMELAAERSITHYLSQRSETTLGVGIRPKYYGRQGSTQKMGSVQSGELKASIRSGLMPHPGPNLITAYLRSEGVWYAKLQNEGWDKPITQKTSPYLFFWWEKIQSWVRTKKTGGFKARPFIRPAIIDEMETIREMLNSAVFESFQDWKTNKLSSPMGYGEY
jgi:hypothetical protein